MIVLLLYNVHYSSNIQNIYQIYRTLHWVSELLLVKVCHIAYYIDFDSEWTVTQFNHRTVAWIVDSNIEPTNSENTTVQPTTDPTVDSTSDSNMEPTANPTIDWTTDSNMNQQQIQPIYFYCLFWINRWVNGWNQQNNSTKYRFIFLFPVIDCIWVFPIIIMRYIFEWVFLFICLFVCFE